MIREKVEIVIVAHLEYEDRPGARERVIDRALDLAQGRVSGAGVDVGGYSAHLGKRRLLEKAAPAPTPSLERPE